MAKVFPTEQQNSEVVKPAETIEKKILPVWLILLILGGYAIISIWYALLIPKWLPYDEPSHFYYVAHLAGFSNFVERGSYEMTKQPPLAYLVYSPVLRLVANNSVALQLLSLRLETVVLGVINLYVSLLVLTNLIGKYSYSRWLLLVSGVILAFNPAFIATNSSVTNDTFFELLMSLTLLISIRAVEDITWLKQKLLLVGILLGLAGTTKALALPLLILPLCIPLVLLIQRKTVDKMVWFYASCAVVIGITVASPYYLTNWLIYNDVFGENYWRIIDPNSHPMTFSDLKSFFPLAFSSYWSFVNFLRNALIVRPKVFEYVPFLLISVVPLLGAAKFIWQKQWQARISSKWWITIIFGSLMIASYLYKNLQDYGPDGRYLFTLSAPFSALIALNLYYLLAKHPRVLQSFFVATTIFMVGYAVYAALTYLTHAPNLYPHLYEDFISRR